MGLGSSVLSGVGDMYKILALAAAAIWLAVLALPDNKLHLVVCDVGQGDAILVTYKTTQMLVDGGPNSSVLKCLGEHMPFYDHRIEVVVSTHDHMDHTGGLANVRKRYTILQFVGKNNYAGDVVKAGEIMLRLVWPPRGEVMEDENNNSRVGLLTYGNFRVWLTGDVNTGLLPESQAADVLKVPHHGSKYGMTREWLEAVRPQLAIISAGQRNSYGHPAPEALRLLQDIGAKVLRTDRDGTVEVVSDGLKWWVRN
ncbi:MAG: internalization competence protein ComEC/Rec2-like protein [Candidatus Amesbacteria bacterium GW2011_GWC2_45_19]|uniref:Internalization competence protein ComEC/Rec2-like protein n=1 Tax=Candidatus Amesbacteria bacterium GW2011_GWC2_45_19 TaxID=1618366 RepID=A0A0G1M0J7_9BACT|nr:MAG: internalization competence protein ComEC/Rec2-like protein [Candidatus Amesbacteria bacterium GW2011_GWC2_45_19]